MIVPKYLRTALMTGVLTIVIAVAMPAMAQDRQQAQIDELRQIIQQQQQELNRLRSKIDRVDQQQKSTSQAVKDARTASASADAGRKPHKAGAIAIPGTNFDFKFGGYAKADFIYSSGDEASGAEDLFVVPLINTRGGDGSDDQVKVHARQSRINFEVANPDTAFGRSAPLSREISSAQVAMRSSPTPLVSACVTAMASWAICWPGKPGRPSWI